MKYTVYYDSGTTNSRIYLLDHAYETLYTAKRQIGSKDSAIHGGNAPLIDGLYALYTDMLAAQKLGDADIAGIYASGMVTSPFGLKEVPHLELPVTLEAYAASFFRFHESSRFGRDIWLIPGAKTARGEISHMNSTRGEEIEAVGLMVEPVVTDAQGAVALILPGSHTNIMLVEKDRLAGILATFTGELFEALREKSILAPVLSTNVERFDEAMVRMGVQTLGRYGFNRALHLCHTMQIFRENTPEQRLSYVEGVLFGGVGIALREYCREAWQGCRTAVVIAHEPIAQLYRIILEETGFDGDIRFLAVSGQKSYALEGFKRLRALRGEKEQVKV